MLQISAYVSAVNAKGIVAVGTRNMFWLAKWLAQVSAHQVFVSQLSSESCATSRPVEICVQAHSINIGAVVVKLHLVGLSAVSLVAVAVLVPVYAGHKVQSSALCLALNGAVELCGVLILVVGLPLWRCVERARAPALVGYSQVPVQSHVVVLILSLVEAFCSAEVGVQSTRLRSRVTIATAVIGGEGIAYRGVWSEECGVRYLSSNIGVTIRSSFCVQSNLTPPYTLLTPRVRSCHDINRSHQT